MLFNERHRIIDEDARRLAFRIPENLSATGVLRIARDAGQFERNGIHPNSMAIDARQQRRTIEYSRIELHRTWKLLIRPQHLVPATAENPAIGSMLAGKVPHLLK